MRIGIDARFFNESGVGRYLRNLIINLQILDKKNQYFIFLLHKDMELFKASSNFQKISADFNWYGFAEQYKFPNLLRKYNLDLVHFPHFNVPIFYGGRFVVTIHDLIHQHFSMQRTTTHGSLVYRFKQLGYKRVFKHAINKSSKILAPSKHVRNQLINEWKINFEKIIVTPEAVDDSLLKGSGKLTEVVKKPYIFFVGNAHPHKNIEGLIKAFLLIKKSLKDLKLVLSGNDHYFWKRLKTENRHDGIIFTGYVSDKELTALYKNAMMFVMPSFEEGFGIPILEAMACQTPVVSSNAGSLPEVGGDAVLYFDPNNIADMTEKISMVLSSEGLRKELIEKGKKRVKEFSWEKLAKQTLEVYEKCV